MALTETQIELLRGIQSKLRRGDISSIAEKKGLTREYVGMVLSPNSDHFNMKVVEAAAEIISNREQSTKKLLQKVTGA